ncbi:MAG: hypothetical protein A3F68_02460 [Acidobacteria bacterium RIFCSPLOWO2_12_FULL_54_10]|nr:MAG: hypothetical protein A3F68_02460 [Acidobacteria bacterium RIFCSPLOWO2_12_FULL_54_10]
MRVNFPGGLPLPIFKHINALFLALLFCFTLPASAQEPQWDRGISQAAAQSAASKFQLIQNNTASSPQFQTIRVAEDEVNSYLHFQLTSAYPPGVSKIRMQFSNGRPVGFARVDFDQLMNSMKDPPNLIIRYLLAGVHSVAAEGAFASNQGVARFQLEQVTLDGVELPDFAIQYLMDRYVRKRYPNADISKPFQLPFSLKKVIVEDREVAFESSSIQD